MPSMSGWVLREAALWLAALWLLFLCPRCRAGCCEAGDPAVRPALPVSMPSMSGWVLRARPDIALVSASDRFYALDVGLGVARQINPRTQCRRMRFYALDVGL